MNYFQYIASGADGLEGHVARAQAANLRTGADNAQILIFLGVIRIFNACGQDCQTQVGNILGRIGTPTGGYVYTTAWRPYRENYDDLAASTAIFSNLTINNDNFYTNYYNGTSFLQGGIRYYNFTQYFASATSGGNTLGTSRFRASSIRVQHQIEIDANISTSGFSDCPLLTNQEVGTHGYGTYQDFYSRLSYNGNANDTWTNWGTIGTVAFGQEWSNNYTETYTQGFFQPRGALNAIGG
jgi:hypothetical protein